jgi:excisionase family DNA binding protein
MTDRPATKQTPTPEPMWTVADLSSVMKTAPSTIYGWVHEGFIPHIKIGRCVRFRPNEVMAWLDKHAKRGRTRRVPDVEV